MRIRGSSDVDSELTEMEAQAKEDNASQAMTFMQLVSSVNLRRQLIIGVGLQVLLYET